MNRIAIATLALAVLACPASASVVISNKATKHMSCLGGICTPTGKNAVLNAGDLEAMLASGDVSVNTGTGAVSIAVSAPVTWASASRLTLNADNVISIRAAMVVEGTGAMTLTPSGAGLNFYPGGSIAFWDNSSSLVISGNSYTLVSDIATLASDVLSNPAGFYALAKDYDASGGSFRQAAVLKPLTGTFEGLGHTISNFTIDSDIGYQLGLFAEIDGTARDLTMSGGFITCDDTVRANEVGLLVGENDGTLKGISVSGTIECYRAGDVGGVAGANAAPGIIANATSAVNIPQSNVHYAGGIAGGNTGTIQKSSASGAIVAGQGAGGLVGYTYGTVTDSHATGAVLNVNGTDLGGLAGFASGTILRCSASGNVSAKQHAGGLVGYASSLTIDSSFASGAAGSAIAAGGLVGYSDLNVALVNSYARGAATGATSKAQEAGGLIGLGFKENEPNSVTTSYSTGAPSVAKYVGGSAGAVNGADTMSDVYWDLDTSGVSDPGKGAGNSANYPGITGLTTAQLQSGLPAGFSASVWAQSASINNGYPYLIANPPQ